MDAINSAASASSSASILREAAEQRRLQQEQQQESQLAPAPAAEAVAASTLPTARPSQAVSNTEQALQAQLLDSRRVNQPEPNTTLAASERSPGNRLNESQARRDTAEQSAPAASAERTLPAEARVPVNASQQAITQYQVSQSLLQDASSSTRIRTEA